MGWEKASGAVLFLIAAAISGQAAEPPSAPRCEALPNGVEYRTYLPDAKRYLYVSVKAMTGVYPSIFVMVDKNYETSGAATGKNSPYTAWWLDRSKPMSFSADKIRIRWKDEGTFHVITQFVSDPDWAEIAQPIRGLEPDGTRFKGAGTSDTNSYAFQTRLEMQGFTGDSFEVILPSVTFDGVTVTPPVVTFERQDRTTVAAKC